jgi:stalled ribosome rescue protein Dom34
MTSHNHAAVWIDHRMAKIFMLGLDTGEALVIKAHLSSSHLHHKANSVGAGKVVEDVTFLQGIAEALKHSEMVLIMGPGNEKTVLMKYLESVRKTIKQSSLYVESSDHLTDREIIARGREFFHLGVPVRGS